MRLLITRELVTDDGLVTQRAIESTPVSDEPCDCYEAESDEIGFSRSVVVGICQRCGAVWRYPTVANIAVSP